MNNKIFRIVETSVTLNEIVSEHRIQQRKIKRFGSETHRHKKNQQMCKKDAEELEKQLQEM